MQTDVARATFAAGAVRRLAGLYNKLASILCASHARVGGPNGSPARSSESEEVARALDRRGRVHRARRKMPDGEAQAFLKQQHVVHVGTKDANGWPYVVPLVYVYEGGDLLYFHTGGHRGHFESNIRHDARVCAEVSKIGAVRKGEAYACNSSLEYTSVIMFGTVRVIEHPHVNRVLRVEHPGR